MTSSVGLHDTPGAFINERPRCQKCGGIHGSARLPMNIDCLDGMSLVQKLPGRIKKMRALRFQMSMLSRRISPIKAVRCGHSDSR